MASIKSNKLVPVGGFLLFLLFVFLLTRCQPKDLLGGKNDQDTGDRDKPVETVVALSNQLTDMQKRLQSMDSKLQQDRSASAKLTQTLDQKLAEKLKHVNDQTQQTIEQLTQQLRNLKAHEKPADALPVQPAPQPGLRGELGADGFLWYRPLGSGATSGLATPTTGLPGGLLGRLSDRTRSLLDNGDQSSTSPDEIPDIPVYTIPANATLMGSTTMTALIGRVPFGGSVRNPVPFKIVTGRDNLAANDIVLPEVAKAIWSGFATGDGTLKCARGVLTSVTFVFRDGRIRTLPDPKSNPDATTDPEDGLGWISDDRGYPCIPGQYVSNAPENLGKIFLAGAAAGAGDAAALAETTTQITPTGGIYRQFTGNAQKFIAGQAVGNGFREWSKYLVERAREFFDAVVVQPGHAVAINTTKELRIDYAPGGRRVNHIANQASTRRPSTLD